jgi:hypothetical protein
VVVVIIVVTVTFGSIDVAAVNSGVVIIDHCMVVFKRGVVDVAFSIWQQGQGGIGHGDH